MISKINKMNKMYRIETSCKICDGIGIIYENCVGVRYCNCSAGKNLKLEDVNKSKNMDCSTAN